MAAKQYKLEDDLMKKSRPKFNSGRYNRLDRARHDAGLPTAIKCEFCETLLLNPQSILIHQGGFCQSKIK